MNRSLDIRVFKYLSWVLIVLVVSIIGLFFYAQIIGDGLVLPWHVDVTYLPKSLFIEYFQARGESIGFSLDQYINWQQYRTGNMKFLDWPNWVLLGTILISLWLISTAVTYFSRFWYLVTVGVLILLVLQMNLIELQLWGDYGTYVALGLLIISTYFFHAIKPSSSLSLRFLGIGATIMLYLLLVSFFSQTHNSGLVFIGNGLLTPIILSTLFIVFIAGENIYSILKVATSKGGNGKTNLFHFITFGVIYNGMVILFFLNRRGVIDFDFTLFNPFILLIISAISAFYSFDLRFEKQKGAMPISLLKKGVYPSLLLVTLALLAFAQITANDPLVDAFEYIVIISHLAIGGAYFVASFVNFTPLILQNLSVHKVFYKPNTAPLFLINLVSLAFLTALLFYVGFYPVHQIRSAKYNVLGDLSEKQERAILAEQYYKQGVMMDFVNFKSNFQIAKYEREKGNAAEAILSMQHTYFKNGSGKGYTALSNYYNSKDQFFNALFLLKEARADIDSKEVNNNLAFTYRQFNKYDSAYLMLKANWDKTRDDITKGNLLALSTELPNLSKSDSLINEFSSNQTRAMTNAFALANKNNLELSFDMKPSSDTLLLQDDLFLLYNASLNARAQADSTKIDILDYYLSGQYNFALRPFLLQAKAIQLYELGQINEAFKILDILKIIDNQHLANYSFMQGIWSLHQNQRLLSNDYMEAARLAGYNAAEISRVQNAVLTAEIPTYESPSKSWFEDFIIDADTVLALDKLAMIARSNAFDEVTTLGSLNMMADLQASALSAYEILVEAHQINPYSIPIFQAYILAAVNAGISEYALTGLEEIALLMPPEAYGKFKLFIEEKLEERRNPLIR